MRAKQKFIHLAKMYNGYKKEDYCAKIESYKGKKWKRKYSRSDKGTVYNNESSAVMSDLVSAGITFNYLTEDNFIGETKKEVKDLMIPVTIPHGITTPIVLLLKKASIRLPHVKFFANTSSFLASLIHEVFHYILMTNKFFDPDSGRPLNLVVEEGEEERIVELGMYILLKEFYGLDVDEEAATYLFEWNFPMSWEFEWKIALVLVFTFMSKLHTRVDLDTFSFSHYTEY